MIIAPKALGKDILTREELAEDKKQALRFGHCALGKRALYVGGFGLSSIYYLPIKSIRRVFKRIAVTKGFYEGSIYGSLAYLVVIYDDGREKACRFEREPELDALLSALRSSTAIPIGKE